MFCLFNIHPQFAHPTINVNNYSKFHSKKTLCYHSPCMQHNKSIVSKHLHPLYPQSLTYSHCFFHTLVCLFFQFHFLRNNYTLNYILLSYFLISITRSFHACHLFYLFVIHRFPCSSCYSDVYHTWCVDIEMYCNSSHSMDLICQRSRSYQGQGQFYFLFLSVGPIPLF